MPAAILLRLRLFCIAVAGVLFGMPFEYCMEGSGYGFPFAWLHPYHGDWGAYVIHPHEHSSDAIDLLNIAMSLLLWAIACHGARRHLRRLPGPKAPCANVQR